MSKPQEICLEELFRAEDEERFVRVSRRALVNLDHVELMVPAESGGFQARLSDGSQVVVSRHAARQLRRRFGLGPRGE